MQLFFIRRVRASRRKIDPRYLKHKESARSLILARLTHFNQFYNFKWHRVSVRNTRRRWGSCSKKGNLNFCYKLVFLPPDLADYVIVHELCHLGQFNHSKDFWALVAGILPDYKLYRSRLKQIMLK